MTEVELRNIENFILKNVSLKVHSGELTVLLGPNGSGKTTLLKVVAGLIPYRGSVLFNDEPIDNVPPYKRGVGYVPQSPALFTHLTVEENIAFGLKMMGLHRKAVRIKVYEIMDKLCITHLKNRHPKKLSGGEARKVAIARALIINPRILLLDEPSVSLQESSKLQLRNEVSRLIREENQTVIYVTHDIGEATKLNGKTALLNNGELIAVGTFNKILPAISRVLKTFNILKGVITSVKGELAKADFNGLKILIPREEHMEKGSEIEAFIEPDKILITTYKPFPGANTFKGVVNNIELSNGAPTITVSVNETQLKVFTKEILTTLRRGDKVYVKLPIRYLSVKSATPPLLKG